MDWVLVRRSVLSISLGLLISKIESFVIIKFFKTQSHLLEKLEAKLKFVERVVSDTEKVVIRGPMMEKWLVAVENAVCNVEKLLELTALVLEDSAVESVVQTRGSFLTDSVVEDSASVRSSRVKRKGVEQELEVMVGSFENLAQEMVPYSGGGSFLSGIQRAFSSHEVVNSSNLPKLKSNSKSNDGFSLLEKLKDTMMKSVKCLLNDAEEKQITDSGVKEWLDEVKDVVYEADDLLDEIAYKSVCSSSRIQVRDILSSHRWMEVKLGEIIERLQSLVKQKDALGLRVGVQGKPAIDIENTSLVDVSDQFRGRNEEEEESIMKFLLSDDGNSNGCPELEVIGREIARKCKGLPIVAKTIGGLLRSKRDAQQWRRILQSSWRDSQDDVIILTLRLCYLYLPSHLKRCFAYCAIFPKSYEFTKEDVVLLWMAEGLVQPSGDMEMEAMANKYFDDLVSMSFFQQSSSYQSCFVLHDLVSDLAKFVSGKFCFRLEDDGSCMTSKSTRHLSYARTERDAFRKFMGIYVATHLRTFLPLGWSQCWQSKHIDEQVVHGLLPELRHLRVLSLSQYQNVVELPDSIGNLKYLRYLNLSATSIKCLPEIVSTLYHLQTLLLRNCRDLARLPDSINNLMHLQYLNLHGTPIKGLPESLSCLCNLQTLILSRCKDLVELPAKMGALINLCRLDIGGTQLKEMPPQIGKLTKLKKLTHFIVGKHSGSSIKELGKLWRLCGKLCICKLQNVVNAGDVSTVDLRGKKDLKELELRWEDSSDGSFLVLKQLQPHMNVESLSIVGYGGTRFPNWVGNASLSNIVVMKLSGCKYCTSVPPLGQLKCLKDLSITALGQVVAVGPEFYGSFTSLPFRSLKILKFSMMPQWREWISNPFAFPLLEQLHIKECPNLTKAFPIHFPSLITLKIEGCQQLVASLSKSSRLQNLIIDGLYSLDLLPKEMAQISCCPTTLKEIVIMNCYLLKCFPLDLLPMLKTFFIFGCRSLESLSALEESLSNFEYLSSFEIGKCSNLVSFPNGGFSAPNLTVLRLRDCSKLKCLPDCMHSLLPSLVNLEIVDCPELESFPEGGLPSKLKYLRIESCDKLIAARTQWNLQLLPSLSHFHIVMCEEMESFPEKILLPSTLTSLKIWDLQNLTYLDDEGLQRLTSLRELEISNSPNLESMTEEKLPASLSCLSIWQCPSLEQRCEREKGEDWPKISHIPCIEIIH